ncbi:hypothetical protein ACFFKU_14910 [Kineococcus gynurae]|uniref:Polysaccharide deacetylase n=1 Tax=Kineococcus gynurae TaxID=452979 RepID=A0ABV5LTL1_9ACTN
MSPGLDRARILAAAAAVAAEDEDRAGVAMFLALDPGPGDTPPDGRRPATGLARELGEIWRVLAAHDESVTIQDALAVLADQRLRPTPAATPIVPPDQLAAWRPPGTPQPTDRHGEAREVVEAVVANRVLRVVNYHDTPLGRRQEIEAELRWYADRFDPVSAEEVHRFRREGSWSSTRPGIVCAFYDGFASAVSVARPVLDDTGLIGWFYPPTAFLDVPPAEQPAFARQHQYGVLENPAGRLAMTWDDLADLAERHEICGHTATHAAAAAVIEPERVEAEVVEPLARLTEAIGRVPAAWAWLGGSPRAVGTPGDEAVLAAGVRLHVSNAAIEYVDLPS